MVYFTVLPFRIEQRNTSWVEKVREGSGVAGRFFLLDRSALALEAPSHFLL